MQSKRSLSALFLGVFFAIVAVFSPALTQAADQKLGKIFIKAATSEVGGQEFSDPELDAAVRDLKGYPDKFLLTDKESEADFLLIVIERKAVAVSGQPASKVLVATLSVRDGAAWKPAAKLQSKVGTTIWRAAAEEIIKKAENWVKENGGK